MAWSVILSVYGADPIADPIAEVTLVKLVFHFTLNNQL
jgi:hypothetical protein